MTKTKFLALVLLFPMLAACSGKTAEDDSLESFNRGMFAFNEVIDNILIKPVATGYRFITPEPIRDRIGNASDNLAEPLSMVNAFLQGDFDHGMVSFWRFIINSTIGIGGLHDVATTAGLKERREDFGQTLAVWGVGEGPYIVLPILGSSNLRDTTGVVAGWYMDPFTYILDTNDRIWLAVGQGVVERERLIDPIDDIYETSLDPYATFRSVYEQLRAAQIENRYSDLDKSTQAPSEYEEKK